MVPAQVTLDDKYALESGRVYLTGTQALVRLPLMQRRRDLAAGRNTAGFISGYRGSPLAGYGHCAVARQELPRRKPHPFPSPDSTRTWRRPRSGARSR